MLYFRWPAQEKLGIDSCKVNRFNVGPALDLIEQSRLVRSYIACTSASIDSRRQRSHPLFTSINRTLYLVNGSSSTPFNSMRDGYSYMMKVMQESRAMRSISRFLFSWRVDKNEGGFETVVSSSEVVSTVDFPSFPLSLASKTRAFATHGQQRE